MVSEYSKLRDACAAIVISAFLLATLFSCTDSVKKPTGGGDRAQDSRRFPTLSPSANEYYDRYMAAAKSNDVSVVESTIAYIDEVISRGGDGVAIDGAYYNEAELLYRLGRNDEALRAIEHVSGSYRQYYEGTLLLRIGKTGQGREALENLSHNYTELLFEQKPGAKTIRKLIEDILSLYALLGKDSSTFEREVLARHIVGPSEFTQFRKEAAPLLNSQNLLQTLWPGPVIQQSK